MRVDGGTYHRAGYHRPAGLGGRCSGGQLLVDGLQAPPESQRTPATPARVPQPFVRAPRHTVGTDEGLLDSKRYKTGIKEDAKPVTCK